MDDIPEPPSTLSSARSSAEGMFLPAERDRLYKELGVLLRSLNQKGLLRPRRTGKPPAVTFPSVSRERALAVASDVAKAKGREVRDVVSLAELTLRGVQTPRINNVDLSDCWIAFLARETMGIGPSEIVIVDKGTGKVRYVGSANDEG